MRKYQVTQIYATVYNVHKNRKLVYPEDMGVHDANSVLQALQKVSKATGIAEICLHAERIKDEVGA
jgi:hypothetical protein